MTSCNHMGSHKTVSNYHKTEPSCSYPIPIFSPIKLIRDHLGRRVGHLPSLNELEARVSIVKEIRRTNKEQQKILSETLLYFYPSLYSYHLGRRQRNVVNKEVFQTSVTGRGGAEQKEVLFSQKIPPSGTVQLYETIKGNCEIIRKRSVAQCKLSQWPRNTRDDSRWYDSSARAKLGKNQKAVSSK
ncbi:hypothetical protein TNCV_2408901 [Trichonephila clavipes]|nr:hypothetical protein TNCV_2408901 [Trichonephila clavipes]